MYVYPVFELDHTVPLPPTSEVEQLWKHCDPLMPPEGRAHVEFAYIVLSEEQLENV